MIAWGALSVSQAFITNPQEFYTMRFLLGVAEAGFFPGMILYLTYWFPRRQHGLAVARFTTAIPAAGVLGSLVASPVLAMKGLLGLAGWKWLFIITGTPAILLGVAVYFFLSNGPGDAHWLSEEERQLLIDQLKLDKGGKQGTQKEISQNCAANKGVILTLLTNLRVWQLCGLYFLLTVAMYGYQLWLPQILQDIAHLDAPRTALLAVVPPLFQALGMVLVARHSDKAGERKRHLAASAAIAAISLAAAACLLKQPVLSIVALCGGAFGIWGALGPFWAVPTGYLEPSMAAAGIAMINSIGNLGGYAGPKIIGQLTSKTHDFSFGLFALSASLLCASVVAMALRVQPTASREDVVSTH
jgi:ACS family tartrate transporter-like MFS transporter